MLNLGTFKDTQVGVEYDLYRINAQELRKLLDKHTQLTELKLALFNDDSGIKRDIEIEARTPRVSEEDRLKVDMASGKVIQKRNYRDDDYIRIDKLDKIKQSDRLRGDAKIQQIMGYELLPLAVIAKNKDIDNEEVKLLDGFRRMYYVDEIPDIDVFVKVYDILSPGEWQTAMLVFNSWKISHEDSFKLFADRGYKFGLYTRFGIDVTLYYSDAMDIIRNYMTGYENNSCWYIRGSIYNTLKFNEVAHLDMQLLLEVYETYQDSKTMKYFVELLGAMLGELRRNKCYVVEFRKDDIEIIFDSEEMQKHIKKVSGMSVGGTINNYMIKRVYFTLGNLLRELSGNDKLDNKYSELYNGGELVKRLPIYNVTEKELQEEIERRENIKQIVINDSMF